MTLDREKHFTLEHIRISDRNPAGVVRDETDMMHGLQFDQGHPAPTVRIDHTNLGVCGPWGGVPCSDSDKQTQEADRSS